jgi:sec-independent protein translocase protein TatC
MGPEHDTRMPLTAHLEELRWRLVRALAAVGAAFVLCYWLAEPLFAFLVRPLAALRADEALVIGTGVTEAFFTKLKVALIAALFVASPVIFFQAWRFVAPGLYESEKRLALPFALVASVFFVLGAAFCYALVFPVGFRFFLAEYASIGVAPQIRIAEYLSFATRMLLAFGLTFELPVVTFFLARLGLVTHRHLLGWARYAIVVIFVLAAVLTPGPDVASQVLMAAPLLVLYGLSILVALVVARPAAAAVPAPDTGTP